MTRILLCGEGHGALSAYEGLLKEGLQFDVLTLDAKIHEKMKSDGLKAAESLVGWIQSSSDVVLSSAYRPVIPASTLKKCRFLNVHYALFPKYRGLHSIVWALLNGEKEIGITIHEINELVDAGPIVFQKPVPVQNHTSWQLMEMCDHQLKDIVGPVVRAYATGELKGVPQDESKATFVAKRNQEDCRVNWKTWDAEYFERALRALVLPYPRPFFEHKGVKYEISKAQVVRRNYHEIPGHVVYRDLNSVWIKLTDGLLQVFELSLDGKGVSPLEIFKMPGARL